ncbi:unnamed protein product [Moneuplotes crassus]|uniref:Uncharacterized protein n=1 Tax=Euplotes crassus TaxID=5936 RepID=A0AAD1Y634_EUPCR|nr:unnamed protein product [Moneuplotes crassus]
MNVIEEFDEELSDEFLDENASVSSIHVSENLDKNMSKSLFCSKVEMGRVSETESCLLNQSEMILSSEPEALQSKEVSVPRKALPFKKSSYQGPSNKSKLKNNIKTLFKKVKRIRSYPDTTSEHQKLLMKHKKELLPKRSRLVRGVTVHDCEPPKKFSISLINHNSY